MDPKRRLKDIAGPDTGFAYPFDFKRPVDYKNVTMEFELDMKGLVHNVAIREVMNIKGGVLCYGYE
jgi:tyrosinase